MVVDQKFTLGRIHAGQTVTIHITDTTFTIDTHTRPADHYPTSPRIKTHSPKTTAA